MDRIDLNFIVPRLKPEDLTHSKPFTTSEEVRSKVIRAREIQHQRLGNQRTNSKMTPKEIKTHLVLEEKEKEFMQQVVKKLNLSARVFDRILKVGRTIADLESAEKVMISHLSEAIQYRLIEN